MVSSSTSSLDSTTIPLGTPWKWVPATSLGLSLAPRCSAMVVLPLPGSPANSVPTPTGILPSHTHRTGLARRPASDSVNLPP